MKLRQYIEQTDLAAAAEFLARQGRPSHVTEPDALRELLARSAKVSVALDDADRIIGFARCSIDRMRGICEVTLFEVASGPGADPVRKALLRHVTADAPDDVTWKFGDRALQQSKETEVGRRSAAAPL
ncbi:MAG: hypothetical protein H6934_02965 [Burkholderiaceae bacterium]|nr:hypothetical protein [Burkholderiaceae bacterium]